MDMSFEYLLPYAAVVFLGLVYGVFRNGMSRFEVVLLIFVGIYGGSELKAVWILGKCRLSYKPFHDCTGFYAVAFLSAVLIGAYLIRKSKPGSE